MRVLILGGGGTFGAFSAGALEVLSRSGWTPDAFIGSSAGSINLLRYLAGGPEAAISFWTSLRWTRLLWDGIHHDLWRDGLLNPKAFGSAVDQGVDFERMFADTRALLFIVVDLLSGRVAVRGNRSEKTVEALHAVAHASYALPPLFPPVHLGYQLLADGGLLHNAPLDAAVKLGATEIVYLCNVQVLPRQGFGQPSIARSTTRYMDIFLRRASNVGFADAEIVEDRFRGVPFLTIAPPPTFKMHAFLRWMLPSKKKTLELIEWGRWSAEKAIRSTSWIQRVDNPQELSVNVPQA
jgi:NTE family protein